ncbi:hypothetical protein EJ08DRAFT_654688 [Tothia fuscella]|uniref:Uncharacterized protein n=1 Tax=Tothia fuscella TaxID=1048955 RepID=A0A9P4NDZ9_9PEZI|nr:hypothetical protein EJ08DRAFT_654688 [Tothia fuscella]
MSSKTTAVARIISSPPLRISTNFNLKQIARAIENPTFLASLRYVQIINTPFGRGDRLWYRSISHINLRCQWDFKTAMEKLSRCPEILKVDIAVAAIRSAYKATILESKKSLSISTILQKNGISCCCTSLAHWVLTEHRKVNIVHCPTQVILATAEVAKERDLWDAYILVAGPWFWSFAFTADFHSRDLTGTNGFGGPFINLGPYGCGWNAWSGYEGTLEDFSDSFIDDLDDNAAFYFERHARDPGAPLIKYRENKEKITDAVGKSWTIISSKLRKTKDDKVKTVVVNGGVHSPTSKPDEGAVMEQRVTKLSVDEYKKFEWLKRLPRG